MLTTHKPIKVLTLESSFWFPLIAIFFRISPSTADLSYLILAIYALFGKQQVIQALLLSWFFTMINPIVPDAELGSLFRYVVILSCFFTIYLKTSFAKFHYLSLFTLFFGIFILFHSLFFSKIPDVSVLKILNWMIVVILLLKAWSDLDFKEYEDMQKWLTKFLVLIALVSLPTFFIKEIGYQRNFSGFQGILNHPQAFGITISLISSILIGELFTQKKPSFLIFTIIIICFLLIILSKTRTAGLSLPLAIGISLGFFFMLNFFKKKNYAPIFRSYRFFIFLIITSILFILFNSEIIDKIYDFISKSGREDVSNIFESYKKARGPLYVPMLANISKNFTTGIGFGIASDVTTMKIFRDPFFGLPIQASTEKGFLVLMVLEELGIYGFIFFIIWVLFLLYRAASNGIKAFLVVTNILILNTGEAMLFSPGGAGLLFLIVLTSFVSIPKLPTNKHAIKKFKN